jgi:hypothetical protein
VNIKAPFFVEIILLNNGKHGQRNYSTKMGVDTPNAPEFICPSPKVLDFNEKRLHWVSIVRYYTLSLLGTSW